MRISDLNLFFMKLNQIKTIGIVGADIIGQGIAISSAIHGYEVFFYDVVSERLSAAEHNISHEIDSIINNLKLENVDKETILNKIHFTYDIRNVVGELVLENSQVNHETKEKVLEELEKNNLHSSIIVSHSNFSSITQLASKLNHPKRFVGVHLLHPVPSTSLLEVIAGEATSEETTQFICDFIKSMEKIPVRVKDVPGFIVNRLTRPFYLESLKALEEGVADYETIDAILENSEFNMGAFKLMDYLGIDVNNELTHNIFKAFGYEPRFRPNRIEQRKVDVGHLGQKTGKGFYDYDEIKNS